MLTGKVCGVLELQEVNMAYAIIAFGVAIFGIGMTLYFQAQIILKPKRQKTFARQFWWFGAAWMVLGIAAAIAGVIGLFTGAL
jgi:sterol desaturase/sphingolipid hydroxylase (fatty acid hydroxylase superfamily)